MSLLAPDALCDPHAYYGHLREHDPVHYAERERSWVLTRYDDVAAAFADRRLSSDRVQPVYDEKLSPADRAGRAPTFDVLSDWMVFTDPPDHTRLRNLAKLAFTPRAVQRVAPRIEAIVDHVLDLPDAGEVDVVRQIAYPIPAMVVAEMLGVPSSDRDLFKAWSDDVSLLVFGGARDDADRRRAQDGLVALADYLRALLRRADGDDLLTAMRRAQLDDDALTEDEIVHTCILLLFGGHETTTNLIANGLLALIDHPDELDRLLREPELIEPAVEELNRYDGPSRMAVRRAVASIELHGQAIPAGARVFLCQSAANRDPRRFDEPDRLDLGRAPNRHVAFGFGIHYCLGAPLARLEAQIALPRLLRRLRDPTVATDELDWLELIVVRGLRSLPIRYGDA